MSVPLGWPQGNQSGAKLSHLACLDQSAIWSLSQMTLVWSVLSWAAHRIRRSLLIQHP